MGDEGVIALAQGLANEAHTRLTDLGLCNVKMGNAGMAALAGVLRTGRFDRLEQIDLSTDDDDVTDDGVCVFAEAVNERGLPMLKDFYATDMYGVTTAGKAGLAFALIHKCPGLTGLHVSGDDPGEDDEVGLERLQALREAVAGMVRVARPGGQPL